MPRSRTRARRRAQLAFQPAIHDPERTPARMGHWWRKVWKRFAQIDASACLANEGWPEDFTRKDRIRARMNKWGSQLQAAEAAKKARQSQAQQRRKPTQTTVSE